MQSLTMAPPRTTSSSSCVTFENVLWSHRMGDASVSLDNGSITFESFADAKAFEWPFDEIASNTSKDAKLRLVLFNGETVVLTFSSRTVREEFETLLDTTPTRTSRRQRLSMIAEGPTEFEGIELDDVKSDDPRYLGSNADPLRSAPVYGAGSLIDNRGKVRAKRDSASKQQLSPIYMSLQRHQSHRFASIDGSSHHAREALDTGSEARVAEKRNLLYMMVAGCIKSTACLTNISVRQ